MKRIESFDGLFGKLDFSKLKRDIQHKLESDFEALDVNTATSEDMVAINEDYLTSMRVLNKAKSSNPNLTYNPDNDDIGRMFYWLNKKPSDYLIKPISLKEVDLQDLIKTLDLSFTDDEISLFGKLENRNVQLEFKVNCYLTHKFQNT